MDNLNTNTIHDNEVYMDNLNTEIPYMITRFIWTTLIQKYHTW